MRNVISILLLVSSTSVLAKQKIIYGVDNRRDIVKVPNFRVASIAKAVATRVDNFSYKKNTDNSVSFLHTDTLASPWTAKLCKDEKFATQPIVGDCTGFLVGKDLLATAGHCISDGTSAGGTSGFVEYCSSHSWLFDYKMEKDSSFKLENIQEHNLYKCKKIVKAKLFGDEDFALIQLDRPVTGRKPLKLSSKGKVKAGDKLFVVGHPSGLPMKFANDAKAFEIEDAYFSTNLDTFGGNSGSPVFNAKTYEVVGILVRGDIDYVLSTHDGEACRRVNVCNKRRAGCIEDDPQILGEHVSHISRIQELL